MPAAPAAGQTGGAAAPPDPLGASHPALANLAQANRAPGFAVPASAARPHSAAFGGVRGFFSYPVECAFRLPVRSRSSGAGERGAGGSEASPAHRRESEANLKVERFEEKAIAWPFRKKADRNTGMFRRSISVRRRSFHLPSKTDRSIKRTLRKNSNKTPSTERRAHTA